MKWVREVIERVETALIGTSDPLERRRLTVYRLRILGYTLETIAEEMNMSYETARLDLRWCFNNLPPVYANAEDFRRVSIPQLENIFQMLVTPRTVVQVLESGETLQHVELPSLQALKVAREVKDTQAKLLGAYQAVDVREGDETYSYTVTVSKPRFELEGESDSDSALSEQVQETAAIEAA